MDIIILHHFILIVIAVVGATSTYAFHNRFAAINPVFASAILTLLISLICYAIPNTDYIVTKEIPYVFIGSSFIGMSTRKMARKISYIILASLFFYLIYFKSSQFFQGYGGALGVSACISVLIVITSSKLFIRSKQYYRRRKK